jgi:hypothetical protein
MIKKILFTIGIAAAFCTPSQSQVTITEDLVTVEITQETSRYDLMEYKNALAEYGIEFRYQNVDWGNNTTQLLKIEAKVRTTDGRTASYFMPGFTEGQTLKILYKPNDATDAGLCVGLDCE